jgi:hypothetical protein
VWFGRVVAAIVDVQPVCTGAPSDGTGLCDVVRERVRLGKSGLSSDVAMSRVSDGVRALRLEMVENGY